MRDIYKYVIVDIETGPAQEDRLDAMMPEFEAPRSIKDPVKATAAIMEKRADFVERAALNAHTGEVLVIGYKLKEDDGAKYLTFGDGAEGAMLREFWANVGVWIGENRYIVGWNITGFDLPFLIRRSWMLGVLPNTFIRFHGSRRWSDCVVDLMVNWTCGEREQRISLDMAARACGFGGKTGHGKDFAKLYAEDPKAALAYLARDIELTEKLYIAMTYGTPATIPAT